MPLFLFGACCPLLSGHRPINCFVPMTGITPYTTHHEEPTKLYLEQMALSETTFERVIYDPWVERAPVALVEPTVRYPFSDRIPKGKRVLISRRTEL